MPKRRQTRAGGRPRSSGQRTRTGGQRPRGTASAGPRSPGGRPLPAGQSPYTPGASATRQAVERSSARPLLFLSQLPRWVPLVVMLALMITGFAVPGWIGAAALVLVAAFLAWLAYMSWPHVSTRGRVPRVVAVLCVLALAVWQARR